MNNKINPWLKEKLEKTQSPEFIDVIVELEEPQIVQKLRALGHAPTEPVLNMVRVTIPLSKIDEISRIPGVRKVSYNMPVHIKAVPSILDPLMGRISLSKIEVPIGPGDLPKFFYAKGIMSIPFNIGKALGLPFPFASTQDGDSDVIIIPTSETAKFIGIPEDNHVKNVKVAILDTGAVWPHFLFRGLPIRLETLVLAPPLDGLGHGTWSTGCAFGSKYKTRFGICQGMAEVKGSNILSIKVLDDFGFGSNWQVIKGIERAVNWGAQVINMSFGSELQGPVCDDPVCVAIEKVKDKAICIVAAGNSGPSNWTIGSPATSPYVLAVGSWSPFYNGLSIFSSRGPSGEFYRDHPEQWENDLARYGEDLIKIDCCAPGGGGISENDKPDLIYSSCVGWADGIYDHTPFDGWGAFRGTSMAVPHVSGAIALLLEKGLVKNADDIKRKLAERESKNPESGYGVFNLGLWGL